MATGPRHDHLDGRYADLDAIPGHNPGPVADGARSAAAGIGVVMADATLTVTLDDGNVYVDVQCDHEDDLSVVVAIGLLEMAKAILLAPEGRA